MEKVRAARVAIAATRKIRKLSGWNIYQREELGKMGHLGTQEFKRQAKIIARKWKALRQDDQEVFNVQAAFEQSQLEKARLEPLAVQGQAAPAIEETFGRRGQTKISLARLQHNFYNAATHDIWSSPTQLGDCASVTGAVLCQHVTPFRRTGLD